MPEFYDVAVVVNPYAIELEHLFDYSNPAKNSSMFKRFTIDNKIKSMAKDNKTFSPKEPNRLIFVDDKIIASAIDYVLISNTLEDCFDIRQELKDFKELRFKNSALKSTKLKKPKDTCAPYLNSIESDRDAFDDVFNL